MTQGNNVLLIWPQNGTGYYDFNPLNDIFGLKGQFFPLPLLYVAAALGNKWNYTLIDTGIEPLTDKKIAASDFIMISTNILQRESADAIIGRVIPFNKPVIVGGVLTSTLDHVFNFPGITKVIGEIESTEADHKESEQSIAEVLSHDMHRRQLKSIYRAIGHPDLKKNPVPRYDLIDPRRYFNLSLQTSRGCHHCCDFCQEIPLYGKHQRKNTSQVIKELNAILQLGECKSIYIIDDNFMGNISNPSVKENFLNMLDAIEGWQKDHDYPFDFFCQCSLEVADHEDLVRKMVAIGLNMLFIGIESVDESSLASVHKHQNMAANMIYKVRALQKSGMGIFAGMIIGFDNDSPSSIERLIDFVRQTNIPLIGTSLLLALPGTKLYRQLSSENRISSDRNALTKSFRSNVIFKQSPNLLYKLYLDFTKTIYRPGEYFNRCLKWAQGWNDEFVLPGKKGSLQVNLFLSRIIRSITYQGIFSNYRFEYLKYLFKSFFLFRKNSNRLALALYLGYYYRVVNIVVQRLEIFCHNLPEELSEEWNELFGNRATEN